jgi:hypothetical protein
MWIYKHLAIRFNNENAMFNCGEKLLKFNLFGFKKWSKATNELFTVISV